MERLKKGKIVLLVSAILKFYQKYLSLDHGFLRKIVFGEDSEVRICRFQPSCSEYALLAFNKFGFIKGGFLSLKRIARCHPFSKGGFDPIP